MSKYRFGLELELIDYDRKKTVLPGGFDFSRTEIDLVNSDGRAVNPYKDSDYTIGGEITTSPSDIQTQVKFFNEIIELIPEANINYRCQLHVHISRNYDFSLQDCKNILIYSQNKENYEAVNKYVWKMHDKLPQMEKSYFSAAVSKVYRMNDYQYEFALKAKTFPEFKECWFKSKENGFAPLLFKRCYVNIYSVFKHGTIEFRIFRPTLNSEIVKNCMDFSLEFLENALLGEKGNPVSAYVNKYKFADPLPFNIELEKGYQATKVKKK